MTAKFDLLIAGGEAVLPGSGRTLCDIGVEDGKIVAILQPDSGARADRVIDAKGLAVLPGLIDVHLHLGHGKDISRPRVPEDASQETAAAVMGGVTCFVPYLMATEPFEDIFEEVVDVTQAGARIDFGYHFIISTEDQLASVPRYAREFGAPTFKIFMNNRNGEGLRLGLPDIDDGFLYRLCEAAAANGGMVCPHPENIEVAQMLRKRVKVADPDGKGGLATWNDSRPPFVEADAVQRAALLAAKAGAPLYVVHTTSREALEAGLRQESAGAAIYFETCPHYLTHDVTWQGGVVGKVNPPLRERSDCERLWRGLANGEIDTVGTDHVHRDLGSKEADIWGASPGCPGLETLLPVLLTDGFHERGIPLERIVELTASNPARLMGLSHVKGSIKIGLDADFALVDLNTHWKQKRESVVSSAGYSIYEGKSFRGKVVHTVVRGEQALDDGRLVDAAIGKGRYVSRRLEH
jgi:dihydroorotase (multifunctional complex type)